MVRTTATIVRPGNATRPILRSFQIIVALACTFLLSVHAGAQCGGGWSLVGPLGVTPGGVIYPSMAVDGSGTPWIAYGDGANSNKVSVMKYTGGSWTQVGSPGFSTGASGMLYLTFTINSAGVPYVAYQNSNNPGAPTSQKATVMKFDGSSWVPVGGDPFTPGIATHITSVANGSGAPYVAYRDGSNSNKAVVVAFDGTNWIPLGGGPVSSGSASYLSLGKDNNGNIFLAYADEANSSKLTVQKYNGASWSVVGSAAFSAGAASEVNIRVFEGIPYVAYSDGGLGTKVIVKKYDGSNWVTIGGGTVSTGAALFTSLAIDRLGIPYVAFMDFGDNMKAITKVFNGTNWVIATAALTPSHTEYTNLAISADGIPYITYRDYDQAAQKATVKQYAPTLCAITGTSTFCQGATTTLTNSVPGGIWSSSDPGIATAGSASGIVTGTGPGTATISYSEFGQTVTYDVTVIAGSTTSASGTTNIYMGNSSALSAGGATTYTWAPAASLSVSTGATVTATPTTTTTYTVTGTTGSCASIATITVTVMPVTTCVNWHTIGNPSPGLVFSGTSMVTDASGTAYLAYSDGYNYSKATVKKFDGTNWVNVGDPSVSAGSADNVMLAIGNTGTLYVVYKDGYYSNRLTVKKFDGTDWVVVGTEAFTDYIAGYPSIAIDGASTPYVAYRDGNVSNKLTVKKFDGTNWVTIGTTGFSSQEVLGTSIKINSSGVPYVAYLNGSSYQLVVVKFNGTSWDNTGTITPSNVYSATLAADASGNIFLAYRDADNGAKATVKKFNGSSWSLVGSAGFSTGSADFVSIALDPTYKPYVTFQDEAAMNSVMRYNGTSWEYVGNANFSSVTSRYQSIAISNDGIAYVAYISDNENLKPIVQSYSSGVCSITGSNIACIGVPSPQASNTQGGVWTSSNPSVATVSTAGVVSGLVSGSCVIRYTALGQTVSKIMTVGLAATVTAWGDTTIYQGNTVPLHASGFGSLTWSPEGSLSTSIGTFVFASPNTTTVYTVSSTVGLCVATDTVRVTILPEPTCGGPWTYAGNGIASTGQAAYVDITLDAAGTPYVAYKDQTSTPYVAMVAKYDGTNWVAVGSGAATSVQVDRPVLAVSASGTVYMAYTEPGPGTMNVAKYNGTSWVAVSASGASIGTGDFASIALDASGAPYVAYADASLGNRLTVKKFNGTSWVTAGSAGISTGSAYNLSLKTGSDGTPYVAYTDDNFNQKVTVAKFDGTSWTPVGGANFTTPSNNYLSLALAPGNIPYIVYWDGSTGGRLTVMKYDGTSWSYVGIAGFSPFNSVNSTIGIDGNGRPYVSFQDLSNGRASVMRFNGSTWVYAGGSSVNGGTAMAPKIAVNTAGKVYVGYVLQTDNSRARISTLAPQVCPITGSNSICSGTTTTFSTSSTGGTWASSNESVAMVNASGVVSGLTGGTANISYIIGDDAAIRTVSVTAMPVLSVPGISIYKGNTGTLTVSGATTYAWSPATGLSATTGSTVTFNDTLTTTYTVTGTTNGCTSTSTVTVTVLPVTTCGTGWATLGSAGISANTVPYTSLAKSSGGTTYVAFEDGSSGKATVMKFNGTTWQTVGTAGFTPGAAGFVSLALSGSTPYIAFSDVANGQRLSVMKFNGSNWEDVGLPGFSSGSAFFISLAIDGSGTPYVAFINLGGAPTPMTMKFNGTSWVNVGTMTSDVCNTTSMAIDGTGAPIVVYSDAMLSGKAVCVRFDGTNWTTIGSAGFTPSSAAFAGIGLDGSDRPYVSYKDGSTNKAGMMMYNGTNWVAVGSTAPSAGTVNNPVMTMKGNTPYMAFQDATASNKGRVVKYDGTNWVNISSITATSNTAVQLSLMIDAINAPVLSFSDGANSGKLSVVRYTSPLCDITGPSSVCMGTSATLSDATGGGTWSSSNTGIATVGTSGIVNGVAIGTVTISYTALGETTTHTLNVTPTFSANSTVTNVLCYGGSTGAVSVTATGGSTPYTGTGNFSGKAAGTYSFTVTDAGGCVATITATVTQPAAVFTVATTTVTDVRCFGGGTGSIQATYTGGTTPYPSSTSFPGLTAGSYSIAVTDHNGCPARVVATVNQPAQLVATKVVTNVRCNGETNGSVIIGGTGGTTPYTGTGTFSSLPPGSFSYTITDNKGCTASTSGTITQPAVLVASGSPVTSASGFNLLCNKGTTGIVNVSATGGTTPYSNTGAHGSMAAGNYNFIVTDANGCLDSTSGTLTEPAPFYISAVTNDDTICNGSAATLSATGGTGTFKWFANNGLSSDVTTSSPVTVTPTTGTPTITVGFRAIGYNSLGCSSEPDTVNETVLPIGYFTGPNAVCTEYSVDLDNGTSGGTWFTPDTAYISLDQNGLISANAAFVNSTYPSLATISYTMPNGCMRTKVQTVNITPQPLTGIATVCPSSSLSLPAGIPSGGTWSSSNTNMTVSVAANGIATVYGATAGMANISYTMPTGCYALKTFTVAPLAPITGPTQVCAGNTIQLSHPLAGAQWSSSTPSMATVNISTGVVSGLSASTATISYKVNPTCYTTYVITVNTTPSAIAGASSVCTGSTTTLTDPTAGGSWQSSNTAAATIGSSTGTISGLDVGVTTISYTMANGCYKTTSVTVNQTPDAITGATNVCATRTATFTTTSTGGSWSSSASALTINAGSGLASGVAAGTANVLYTMPTGCYSVKAVTVAAMPAAITGTNTVCEGATTTLSSTTPSLTWSSTDENVATVATATSTTGTVSGLLAGTSIIAYTSAAGCMQTVNVTVYAAPGAIGGSTNICAGSTATYTNSVTGGTWSSSTTGVATVGSLTGMVTGIGAGTTTLTYLMPGGCKATKVVTIDALPTAISGTLSTCVGGNTTLTSTPTGQTWSSVSGNVTVGSTTGIVTGVATGTALVSYTNAAGCARTATVSITNGLPAITAPASICSGGTTTFTNATTGGTWTSSNTAAATIVSTSGFITGVSAGTSTITYRTSPTCFTTTSVTVFAAPAAITGPSTSVCVNAPLQLDNTTTGGTWSSSTPAKATVDAISGIVTGVTAGTTTISYVPAPGCIATYNVTVNAIPNAITGSASVCIGSATTLATTSTGGSWSSSNTGAGTVNTSGTVSGVDAGNTTISYKFTTTGCFVTKDVTVNPLPNAIVGDNSACAGVADTFTNATTGGTWSSSVTSVATIGSATGILTGIAAGTTTLSYTLATGCRTTKVFTVYAIPATGITGTATVCEGTNTTLNCTTPGLIWSSANTAKATIVAGTSTSGIVTGVVAGTSTISYTNASGCARTIVVTVNATPQPISGPTTSCGGRVDTLTDATPSGTWSSSNTSAATIGSATGYLTGLAGGTTIISYTLNGCRKTSVITVNSQPGSLSGPSTICGNNTTVLTATNPGGTWASSNTDIATVASTSSTTGTVTGGATTGTVSISYSLIPGCARVLVVTVNPALPAVSGPDLICVGSGATYISGTGGTWVSSATAKATIGFSTGIATGSSVGTTTLSYKVNANCFTTKDVTVNAAVAAITGTTTLCKDNSTTLACTTPGGTWSSSNTTNATVDDASGAVTGTAAGGANISYQVTGTGCYKIVSVNVLASPATIDGTLTVAIGTTTTLNNTVGGGTWSSSATSVASIGSASGIMNGVALGTATITYKLANGCGKTATANVVTSLARPVKGTAAPDAGMTMVRIFPNPSQGNITIETPVSGSFAIFTMDGKQVTKYDIAAPAASVSLPYDLAAGMYMCRFDGADGSITTIRLVYKP